MSKFINIGNEGFRTARNGEYVDKSKLIGIINGTLNTKGCFTCVTRCRRFGKSMAAEMLRAYYDRSCDSRELFQDLNIAQDPSFEKYLNKFPVIYVDMTDFATRRVTPIELTDIVQEEIKEDLLAVYPQVQTDRKQDLMGVLIDIANETGDKFIMIIDEWDAICREALGNQEATDRYVNLLRRLFKGANTSKVFAAVYMTGILPIKKYNTQSALNNFWEYSMVMPGNLAGLFGFTKEEVASLCVKFGMDMDEVEKWYDGYQIGKETHIFNPSSVIRALYGGICDSYWSNTGAYDAVATYVQMNFEGLKDDIVKMLAGGRCGVNPSRFQNDMSDIRSKDDVLTVLIHLGYLAYDWDEKACYIPNLEVAGEMVNAVSETGWKSLVEAIDQSRQLLKAAIAGDSDAVARGVDAAHDENTSILSYSDENSLACVLSIAFYAAKSDYIIHRELASGKGFADLVLIPRKNVTKPAMVIELKCDKDADSAIDQIHRKQYPAKVAECADRLLLVGITYDRKTKTHTCVIEGAS